MTLFALIFPGWVQIVESGWESVAPPWNAARSRRTTSDCMSSPPDCAIGCPGRSSSATHASSTPRHARLGPAQDVYIHNGRIAALYETGSPAREAATVLEAGGRVLLPGLFDMHGHETSWAAPQHMAAGVTTVRDMGNDNAVLAELSPAGSRRDPGPSHRAGRLHRGPERLLGPYRLRRPDLGGVKKAIDWYAQRGYPQIKIYNSFRPEWVSEAIAYAHQPRPARQRARPGVHEAEDVVRQGFDEIQHINQVLLKFFVKPRTTRGPWPGSPSSPRTPMR